MDINALIGRLLTAAIRLVSRTGNSAAPAITAGYIAAIGHPFPTTRFLLAVVIELLCILSLGTRITALALAMRSVGGRG